MTKPTSFSELLAPANFAWPKKGDRLIKAKKRSTPPVFPHDPLTRQVFIWDGYAKAGEVLIDQCERNPLDQHDLIFPILFCYRHSLELAIKWTIDQYGRYANPAVASNANHDLLENWKICRHVILSVGSDGDGVDLKAVDQIVKDFHEMDKSSMTFRYATNQNGSMFDLRKREVDLKNVRQIMKAVNNFFPVWTANLIRTPLPPIDVTWRGASTGNFV